MRTTLRKISAGFRHGTALFLLLSAVAGTAPACAESGGAYSNIDDITAQTQLTLAAAAVEKKKDTDADLQDIAIRQNGQIYGRGVSDEPSRAEPDYTGLVGYAAVANNREVDLEAGKAGFPWTVPAYTVYARKWYYTQPLQHKTGVLVIRQVLKASGSGLYTGRLKIIRLDTGEICWMDVENFVTVPYWFYPVRRAVKYGNTVASYRRSGRRFPADEQGNAAEVADGTDVLIPGNGTWDMRSPGGSRMIPGIVFGERTTEQNGREVTETVSTVLLFPEEELTIIY